jgi:hypothetical protein
MAAKKKRSSTNKQRQTIIREDRPGQIEAWQEAAHADGRTFVSWVRVTLDRAVDKWRKTNAK